MAKPKPWKQRMNKGYHTWEEEQKERDKQRTLDEFENQEGGEE